MMVVVMDKVVFYFILFVVSNDAWYQATNYDHVLVLSRDVIVMSTDAGRFIILLLVNVQLQLQVVSSIAHWT